MRFICTREQELTEGEYTEGVVVEAYGKYYWLLENGDCTVTDVSEADLNCADEFLADEVFRAISAADEKYKLHYSVDKVGEFAEDFYTAVREA
jgi:hypothetical protein